MEDPKEVTKTTIVEGVKDFIEVAKERKDSPSSPWWNKVGAMAGPTIGGVSYLMTIEGIPKWVRLTLGFVIGFLGYWVPTRFGTTNKTTAQK